MLAKRAHSQPIPGKEKKETNKKRPTKQPHLRKKPNLCPNGSDFVSFRTHRKCFYVQLLELIRQEDDRKSI